MPGFRQVRDRVHVGQPGAPLEGMQLLLQLGEAGPLVRGLTPLRQVFVNGLVDFQALVEEQADQVVAGAGLRCVVSARGCLVGGPRGDATQDGLDLFNQVGGRCAGFVGGHVFHHVGEPVVAGEQQVEHVVGGGQTALSDPLKQILEHVAEIANGLDTGHAGTALKGVDVPLQCRGDLGVGRVLAPAVQGAAGGVDQVVSFLQEDADQLGVQGCGLGSGFRLGLRSGGLDIGNRRCPVALPM